MSKKNKKAFITGITGQDGSYLGEFLLKKGYQVHGLRRRSSQNNLFNLKSIDLNPSKKNNFYLHYGDITDSSNLNHLLSAIKPDEIYNLAAQSDVHLSFKIPEYTAEVNAIGCLRLLEAVKNHCPNSKFYQASTSELYGNVEKINSMQNENTKFNPCSPYGLSKLYSYNLVDLYKKTGFFACNGILFNHESPRRGTSFVTRKIVEAAVKIKKNQQDCLFVGNLYSKRDWGYAKEYVKCMWQMLQLKKPENFVIATGKTYTIKFFLETVFKNLNIHIHWRGKGLNEVGIDKSNKKIIVKIDPYYFRPLEVSYLRGSSKKAKKLLKWEPKVDIKELIKIMVNAELKL